MNYGTGDSDSSTPDAQNLREQPPPVHTAFLNHKLKQPQIAPQLKQSQSSVIWILNRMCCLVEKTAESVKNEQDHSPNALNSIRGFLFDIQIELLSYCSFWRQHEPHSEPVIDALQELVGYCLSVLNKTVGPFFNSYVESHSSKILGVTPVGLVEQFDASNLPNSQGHCHVDAYIQYFSSLAICMKEVASFLHRSVKNVDTMESSKVLGYLQKIVINKPQFESAVLNDQ